MEGIHLPQSVSEREKAVWIRIILKRKGQVERMESGAIKALLISVETNLGDAPSVLHGVEQFLWVLKRLVFIALDATEAVTKRREAYHDLCTLIHQVNETRASESNMSNTEIEENSLIPHSANETNNAASRSKTALSKSTERRNQDVATVSDPLEVGRPRKQQKTVHSSSQAQALLSKQTDSRSVSTQVPTTSVPQRMPNALMGVARHDAPAPHTSLPQLVDNSNFLQPMHSVILDLTSNQKPIDELHMNNSMHQHKRNQFPSSGLYINSSSLGHEVNVNGNNSVIDGLTSPPQADTSTNVNSSLPAGPVKHCVGINGDQTSQIIYDPSLGVPFPCLSGTLNQLDICDDAQVQLTPMRDACTVPSLTSFNAHHQTAVQPPQPKFHRQWFPKGFSHHTGALYAHPRAEFTWRQADVTDQECNNVSLRLKRWDPYWKMLDAIAVTKTSTILNVAHMEAIKKGEQPPKQNQALDVRVELPIKWQKGIKGWGRKTVVYAEHDIRLLLRMLPCEPPQKPTGKSAMKKRLMRSDYHLWPKGTLLLVNHDPVEIIQRKQQSHDHQEWSLTSKVLDLSAIVQKPAIIPIRALCHDCEPYFLSVAVCMYLPPEELFDKLMNGGIEKISMKDALENAILQAERNKICVIDEDIVHDSNTTSSFHFQLTCPITMMTMKTAVRAKQCSHFQCFDLLTFLHANLTVSGTRWECPVCSDQIISIYDLQHCMFTQMLIENHSEDIEQRRIEFFSDGQWKICGSDAASSANCMSVSDVDIIDIL